MQSRTRDKEAMGKQNVSTQGNFPEPQRGDPDFGYEALEKSLLPTYHSLD